MKFEDTRHCESSVQAQEWILLYGSIPTDQPEFFLSSFLEGNSLQDYIPKTREPIKPQTPKATARKARDPERRVAKVPIIANVT